MYVKAITEDEIDSFYDLTVPDANHYFAGGVIHHNSAKTHESACFGLTAYWCWPNAVTVLISSTDARSLELRIWGEIKKLFEQAKTLHPGLEGRLTASRQMITTAESGQNAKDFRNGIVAIPCVQNGRFVGLGKYVGIKNKRLILIADEAQFMAPSFFDAFANLGKNPGFKGIAMGNPKDPVDPLGKVSEPSQELGGWEGIEQGEKTRTWPTRIPGGIAVQLVGTDSPNHDFPEGKEPYPFLIGRESIARDLAYYGKDSLQYQMMNLGIMPKVTQSRRVITMQICREHGALEKPTWEGTQLTDVIGIDAAYSAIGGDRTALCHISFGNGVTGKPLLAVVALMVVPVRGGKHTPEDQIAMFVKDYAIAQNIPPHRIFFDSTGRGTLMASFARLFSPQIVPIEFGGRASDRQVSNVIQVPGYENYINRVSELWYQTRYIIEADQMAGMTEELIEEGAIREWTIMAGKKIQVEPKEITKQRMGRSPDLYDSFVSAVEGARQSGFKIIYGINFDAQNKARERLQQIQAQYRSLHSGKELRKVA